MATKRALELQARELNRTQRNLRSYSFFSAGEFWCRTTLNDPERPLPGCSIISGGSVTKRETFLLSMLAQTVKSRIPTVILADGKQMPGLDRKLIGLLHLDPGAELVITSGENRNYQFFQGWPLSQIVEFMEPCGDSACGNMAAYLQQYLTLVRQVYGETTLQALLDAEEEPGHLEIIERLARRLGDRIDPRTRITLNYLHMTTEQRQQCEAMVRRLGDGLGGLQTNAEGYSLRRHRPGPGQIVMIHTEDAADPELLTKYLQKELSPERTLPFHLILCECADETAATWAKDLIKTGSSVTICTQSAYASLGEEAERLPWNNLVFLREQGTLPLNTERELSLFGTFDHWQVTEGGSSPPEAFSFWTGTHAGLVNTKRGKVIPQDIGDCEAVLYGHRGLLSKNEIALVRRVCD